MRQVIVLLPAFNEEVSIDAVISKIMEHGSGWNLQIIVCNDGSTDGTAARLEELCLSNPISVITHSINRGLGETVRDLFECAAKSVTDDGVVIRLDCDDSHEPKYMQAIIDRIDEGYDVVIASRFKKGGGQLGVNSYRKFISLCANLYMKLFFPIKGVKDYTCGYRGYRGSTVKETLSIYGNNFIQLKGLGFTCTLEKLVKLNLLDRRITEVPFIHRYDQKLSESKMVTSITVFGYIVMVIMHYWPWGGWRSSRQQKRNVSIDQV